MGPPYSERSWHCTHTYPTLAPRGVSLGGQQGHFSLNSQVCAQCLNYGWGSIMFMYKYSALVILLIPFYLLIYFFRMKSHCVEILLPQSLGWDHRWVCTSTSCSFRHDLAMLPRQASSSRSSCLSLSRRRDHSACVTRL